MQQNSNNFTYLGKKLDNINNININSKYDLSKYKNLNDFNLDNDLLNKFSAIVEKLNLSQESLEILLDIALEMSTKQKDFYEKDKETIFGETIQGYNDLFNKDNDIPSKNPSEIRKYMQIANNAYENLCSENLKELLNSTGLVFHPEMIKLFYKIGELLKEDDCGYFGSPALEELTPAQILYGSKE